MVVQSSKEGKKSAFEVELMPLHSYLRYEFLGHDNSFHAIINAEVNSVQLEKLLDLLKK